MKKPVNENADQCYEMEESDKLVLSGLSCFVYTGINTGKERGMDAGA